MKKIVVQKRTFIAKAGKSTDSIKNAANATTLQKKYVSAFDIDNNGFFNQQEADLFNATTFSEKTDGSVIFWTLQKDGTKQGKKFRANDKNIKYYLDLKNTIDKNIKNDIKEDSVQKSFFGGIKRFFYNIREKFKTESLPQINKDTETEWTKKYNWSEGCNRKISTIVINEKLANDLKFRKAICAIGQKAGFKIAISEYKNEEAVWMEDYCIRRADGKIYILPEMPKIERDLLYVQNTRRNSRLSSIYAEVLKGKNIVQGKSYLEGGNVLNTRLENGQSGAIIGEKSIKYSLKAMKLEETPENIEIVKKQIAQDLGLKAENITYIRQTDFHIDMFYRPLQDGAVAVPDYNEAIKILENTDIKEMDKKQKDDFIERLRKIEQMLPNTLKRNEEILEKAGYKIYKIPCFSIPSDLQLVIFDKTPRINYQNGVCGTSADNRKYIILNQSYYEELNNKVTEYYKKAGIDDIYFVPTQKYLVMRGGIDCLTQEK